MYKILLRLVGIWRCYDKNASACFLEHGEFCWFFGRSYCSKVISVVEHGY